MIYSHISKRHYDVPDWYESPVHWIPPLDDALIVFAWAVGFTVARVLLQNYFKEYAERNKIKESYKFSESSWKVCFYVLAWTWGVRLTYVYNLLGDTSVCWKFWPTPPTWEPRAFYLFQLGFYWHSLYAHFVYEVKRSDFWPLLIHHVVTIFLIYFSYITKFYYIGVLVLICHDINDILLEAGKTFVYRETWKKTTHFLFAMIMLFWVLSRLLLLPLVVINTAMWDSISIVPVDVFPFWFPFNGSLVILQCLHFFWFYLMIQLLYRIVTGKDEKVTDTREDGHETKKTK